MESILQGTVALLSQWLGPVEGKVSAQLLYFTADYTSQLLHGFPGGPETFVNALLSGSIRDGTSILSQITIHDTSGDHILGNVLQLTTGDTGMSVQKLLSGFLARRGLPLGSRVLDICERFTPILQAELRDSVLVESTGYRSRILMWATTGSPHIDMSDSGTVKVSRE